MLTVSDLEADIKAALKANDKLKLLVLRSLKSALHNEMIAAHQKEPDDKMLLVVLKKEVKKRKDAIDLYTKGGRDDLVANEKQELDILGEYMPPTLTVDDIIKVIDEVLAELPSSEKDFGTIMKSVMIRLQGQADGKLVSELVKKHIN